MIRARGGRMQHLAQLILNARIREARFTGYLTFFTCHLEVDQKFCQHVQNHGPILFDRLRTPRCDLHMKNYKQELRRSM